MRGRFYTPRESLIPKGALKVADKQSDAVAYLYERAGAPYAMVFFGKQAKPVLHYRFKDPARRAKSVETAFTNRREWIGRKNARHAERKAFVHPYKVGDVFKTSWGYDQTNIEYFECVDVAGKHLVLREIAQDRIETAFMQGKCVPLPGQYIGEPIRRLANQYGVKIDEVRHASFVPGETIAGVRVISPGHWTSYA